MKERKKLVAVVLFGEKKNEKHGEKNSVFFVFLKSCKGYFSVYNSSKYQRIGFS